MTYEFFKLYSDGKSDKEIAEATQYSVSHIRNWRNKAGLPTARRALRESLWRYGASDKEIARQTGYTVKAVRKWRQKLGRESNWQVASKLKEEGAEMKGKKCACCKKELVGLPHVEIDMDVTNRAEGGWPKKVTVTSYYCEDCCDGWLVENCVAMRWMGRESNWQVTGKLNKEEVQE